MNNFSTTLSVFCFAFLTAVLAHGAGEFGGPEAVGNRIEADSKDREQPFKERLATRGLQLALDYSAVAFKLDNTIGDSNDSASGGMLRIYGSWEAIGKDSGNAGSLTWKMEHRHSYSENEPRFITFNGGVSGLETPSFSDQESRLTNLYWRQKINGGKAAVMVGLLDVTDYVDVYAAASPWTGFMNFAFSTGTTTMALPNDAAMGVAAATMLGQNFFIIGGVADMESDPTKPFDGFLNDNHLFKTLEIGWTSNHDQIYVDNIHLTIWDADESNILGQAADSGFNFSASKLMGAWLSFVRYGQSDNGSLLGIDESLSGGFLRYGLGGKNNNLGVAVNWADANTEDDQVTLEAFYIMQLSSYWELSVDLQFVDNPANNLEQDSVFIYGLRTRLVW